MPRDSVEGRASGASSLLRVVPVPAPCRWVPPSQWGAQCVPVPLAPLRGTGPVPPGAAAGLGFGGSRGSPGTSAPRLCGVSAVTHPAKRCPGQEGHILGREAVGVMEVAGPRQLPSLPPVPSVWVPVGQGTWAPSGAPLSPDLRVLRGAATGLWGTSSGNGARGPGPGTAGGQGHLQKGVPTGFDRVSPSPAIPWAHPCTELPRAQCPLGMTRVRLSCPVPQPFCPPFWPSCRSGEDGCLPEAGGTQGPPLPAPTPPMLGK